jgi:hypothetical protein
MTVGRMKRVDPGRDPPLPPTHQALGTIFSVGSRENMKPTTFLHLFFEAKMYEAFPPLMYTFMAWYLGHRGTFLSFLSVV